MKEELISDALVRDFLLGKLAGEQLERMETLFLTDSQIKERVAVIEQDLIEDYLENGLTTEDRERFLLRYAQTDEQQHKLGITESIRDWAVTEARTPHSAPVSISAWDQLRTQLRLKPVFVLPIAAIVLITIALAVVWLNSRIEQRKHFAIEQELAQLNSPTSLREVPSQMISFDVRPVTARSVEAPRDLSLPAGIRLVELRLPWIQKVNYSTYQAEIHRVSDNKMYTIRNLPADSEDRNIIRIRLSTDFLVRGQYQVNLSGIANDGSLSSPEEYSFVVSN